jgi:SWI/SNF-related matrix-associated actin-dependent regulator of chromatin subfamily A3
MQPIEAGSSVGFKNLRTLLKAICIRRTRNLLHLMEPRIVEYKLHLSPAEHSRYLQIGESYRQAIDDAVCGKNPSEAYRTIFQALLKLRMLCNHGTCDATSVNDEADDTLALLQEGSASCARCGIEVISDEAEKDFLSEQLPACSHVVCEGCIQQYQEDLQRPNEGSEAACPVCKVSLNEDFALGEKRAAIDRSQVSLSEDGVSTKLSKLLEDIKEHRYSDKW